MSHEHHHHHGHSHTQAVSSLNKAFVWGIALNLAFVIVEFVIGKFVVDSIGLVSDAAHNLSDVVSLVLAMLAFRLAKVHSNNKYTYGYKKSTILVSLTNAIILLFAILFIILESIKKIRNPEPIAGEYIAWVAGVGILVNGFTAWLFLKDKDKDLNVKGAYLHMLADALVSVGVVVSGIVLIIKPDWMIIDPIIGLIIAGIIIYSTWGLLHDSMRLALDGVPVSINRDEIEKLIRSTNDVEDVHHLHIWAISTTQTALTAHIVILDMSKMEEIKHELKHLLADKEISHATLEFESPEIACECDCE